MPMQVKGIVQVNVRLPVELDALLEQDAERRGLKKSGWLREAVESRLRDGRDVLRENLESRLDVLARI